MQEYFNSLQDNETWELVSLPSKRKLVQCKWVYTNKVSPDGYDVKYNSILVSKWFSQVQWVEYIETFAPVTNMDSIRLVLVIVASKRWEVHHMDVKSAFIHGEIKEEIYMQKPEFFEEDPSLVCRLKNSLYGLKQAPKTWYAKMDNCLLSLGFDKYKFDPNVYLQRVGDVL